EALHGNLLYRGVMRVPLVIAGTGIEPGVVEEPVSLRLIRATLLGRARGEAAPGLLDAAARTEVVLGEAMKPYLAYGWQPQVMALAAHRKLIRAGEVHELYDLLEDPAEQRNLAGGERVAAPLAAAARDYPLPGAAAAAPAELDADEERRLASLGYLASSVEPVRRPGAPLPREMTGIFAALDTASRLFVQGEYGAAATAFAKLEQRDPGNLMVVLRRAVALSLSGRVAEAEPVFERARDLAPESADVVVYTGLHALRRGQWERAAVLLGP